MTLPGSFISKIIFILAVAVLAFMDLGCGVKGVPLPPENPPSMTTGQYNYKKATDNIRVKRKDDNQKSEEGNESEP